MASRRMRGVCIGLLSATLAASAAMAAAAQGGAKPSAKPAKREPLDLKWKPTILSATAIGYGEQLQESAPEALKSWVQEQVKKQLRNSPVDPKTAMALADQRFATASEEARDAVTYLLCYAAYQDEDENQRMLAFRIRDIDRETIEITRQLQVLWKNEQVRSVSPNQPASQQQHAAQEEEIQRMETQLREYADERQLKATQLAASRKKVNAYLKLLSVVHPRMEGVAATVVRGIE